MTAAKSVDALNCEEKGAENMASGSLSVCESFAYDIEFKCDEFSQTFLQSKLSDGGLNFVIEELKDKK